MRFRRFLSVFLCVVMVLSFSLPVSAADGFVDNDRGGGFGDIERSGGKFETGETSWDYTSVKYAVTNLYDFITFVVTGAANAFDEMADNAIGNMRENFQENVIDNLEFFKDIVDTVMYHDYVSTLDLTEVSNLTSYSYYPSVWYFDRRDISLNYVSPSYLSSTYGGFEFSGPLLSSASDGSKFAYVASQSFTLPAGLFKLHLTAYTGSSYHSSLYGSDYYFYLQGRNSGDTEWTDITNAYYGTGGYNSPTDKTTVSFSTIEHPYDSYRIYTYFSSFLDRSAGSTVSGSRYGFIEAVQLQDPSVDFGIDGYEETTRPSALMNAVNKYNEYCSFYDNSTEVNYYLVPSGEIPGIDNTVSPVVYDEETFVFTEPATRAQYQTTGWSYDYTTRTYDIALDAGTYTIDGTDVTQIVSTYGDEKVTIVYYDAAGTALATDEYDYVMISQSACSINGHTNTVETTKEPTCTTPGERVTTCSLCGHQTVEDLPKLEHSFANYTVQTEPTCTNKGIAANTCLTCGSEVTELLDPLGHDWLPTSITDESWVMPDDVYCPDCHGTSFTHTRSDYELVVGGKNLLNLNLDEFNAADLWSGRSKPVVFDSAVSGVRFKPNTQYTISLESAFDDPAKGLSYFRFHYTDGSISRYTGYEIIDSRSGTDGYRVFTSAAGKSVSSIIIEVSLSGQFSLSWIQLEEGSEPTEYEPYIETEVEIIPPIYNFLCSDCSTEWTAEAVYQHAYTTFTCSRCDETMIQSEDPDTGLFASIGNLLADAVTWVTDKLSELVDSLSGLNDLFQDYMDQIKDSGGEYPAFLAAFVAILPDDLMTVLWFSLIAALVLVVWKKWFS